MAKRTRAHTSDRSMFRVAGAGANIMLGTAVNGLFDTVSNRTELMVSKLRTEAESFVQYTKSQAELFMNSAEERAMHFRARVMQRTFASILIGVGAMLLIGALFAYLIEFLELSWASSLLIIGVIMIAAAFLVQWYTERVHGRSRI